MSTEARGQRNRTMKRGIAIDHLNAQREPCRHSPSRIEDLHRIDRARMKPAFLERLKRRVAGGGGADFIHTRAPIGLLDGLKN